MISRRNYFTITIVMFIVFFLFQFSNVALESWNHYEENSFIVDTEGIPNKSDAYSVESGGNTEDFSGDSREMVIYIGEKEEALGETVSWWVTYTKRSIRNYQSLEEYEAAKETDGSVLPLVIAVDSKAIDWNGEKDSRFLEEYVKSGINLIFCNLPDVSVVKENQQMQDLLGIQMIRAEKMALTDIHLHKGFLLGGETIYSSEGMEEGMEFELPWYVASPDAEIYMNGITKEKSIGTEMVADEELPAIIWKKDFETASVFTVNGSYMEDVSGLGILSAMSAKMGFYEIYPVVNAQNMVFANYPGLADENHEVMMERYSQSLEGLYQNVIWPDVVAVRRESGVALSCMVSPQLDYEDFNDPDAVLFQRYMKLLNEQGGEAGLSGTCQSDTPLEKKIVKDHKFMQEALPTYQFTSFYADNMTDEEVWNILQEDLLASVRTVVQEYDDEGSSKEVIGYLSEYITRQCTVINGFEDSVRHDFRIRCLETALGYTSILADMKSIVYPEKSDSDWVFDSNTLRQNLYDYRIGEQKFDDTTVSECDERIRSFLALDYKENREFNSIYLEINDTGVPVWFVLRTNQESIEKMEGGNWRKLEEDAFLIEVEQKNAVITLKSVY